MTTRHLFAGGGILSCALGLAVTAGAGIAGANPPTGGLRLDATAITNEAVDQLCERLATSIRGFSSIEDLLAAWAQEDWEFTEPKFQTALRALYRQETVDLPGPPESQPPDILPSGTEYILKSGTWKRVSVARRSLTMTVWRSEATADLWNGTLGPDADQRLESAQIVYHVQPGSTYPPGTGAVADFQTKQAATQTPARPTRSELSGSTSGKHDQPEFTSQLGNHALSLFSLAGQPHVASAKPTAERAFNQGPKENSAAHQASPQPACIGFEFLRHNTGARVTWSSPPGHELGIETSNDLSGWDSIGLAREFGPGVFEIIDPAAAGVATRFYRAVIRGVR